MKSQPLPTNDSKLDFVILQLVQQSRAESK